MPKTFHRWRRSAGEKFPIPGNFGDPRELHVWLCEKCGASLRRVRKPTRKDLRRRGLGETCEEWLVGEVMRG